VVSLLRLLKLLFASTFFHFPVFSWKKGFSFITTLLQVQEFQGLLHLFSNFPPWYYVGSYWIFLEALVYYVFMDFWWRVLIRRFFFSFLFYYYSGLMLYILISKRCFLWVQFRYRVAQLKPGILETISL
jgi:hypothetical protein